MKLETPKLRRADNSRWWKDLEGVSWFCARKFRTLFGRIDPAATIRISATKWKRKGAIRFTFAERNYRRKHRICGPDGQWMNITESVWDLLLQRSCHTWWVRVEIVKDKV